MKSFGIKKHLYSLSLLLLLSANSSALLHKDNPFYYESPEITTLLEDDGTIIKKITREYGNFKYNKKSYILATDDEFEMELDWMSSLWRSVFGESELELQMEAHLER